MTQQPHHDRGHATWSMSANARNMACSGAIAMATLAGPEKESEHAARGTAAHEIAERCLRTADKNCVDFLDETVQTKQHTITIDEELANSAQVYVDYMRDAQRKADFVFIEQYFSLEKLEPPFDSGGTCDGLAVYLSEGLLDVPDFKNGVGAVEASTPQLKGYALLAFLNLDREIVNRIDRVRSTIVQPRAYHKEGIIRSETFHVADLIDWTASLMSAMRRAKRASDAFEKIEGNRVKFDEWAEEYLTPGSHCLFCKAEGFCAKKRKDALKIVAENAANWFENPADAETPLIPNAPNLMSPEQLGHILDGLETLEAWIRAVRSYAHGQVEQGLMQIPGYQLAEKIGNRAFVGTEDETVTALKKIGLTDDQLWVKKLISPAQADKILGKRKDEIKPLVHNPVRGSNLVSVAKATRPAAKSKAEQNFEAL